MMRLGWLMAIGLYFSAGSAAAVTCCELALSPSCAACTAVVLPADGNCCAICDTTNTPTSGRLCLTTSTVTTLPTTSTTTTTSTTSTTRTTTTTTATSTTVASTTSTTLPLASSWARGYGGTDYDSGVGVAVDVSENATLVGQLRGPATAGLADGLVAHASKVGTLLWSTLLGGSGDDAATGVAVDSLGDLYVSMRFAGTITEGSTITASGSGDAALVKIHGADGVPVWARGWGGTAEDRADAVAVDPSGNVYVTGFFQGTALGLTANAALDVYLAKYTSKGTLLWAKNWPNTGNDRGYAVTVSQDGTRVAIGGWFSNGINFTGGATSGCGTTTPTCLWSANGLSNGFVAVLTADGAFVWSRSIGAANGEDATATVAFDRANNLCAGGYAYQAVDFGGGTLPILGNADGWIACYDPAGVYLAARRVGGGGNDYVNGLAYDAIVNALVAVGTSDAAADWGTGAVASLGGGAKDAIIAKYAVPTLAPTWVRRQGGPGLDDAQKVKVAPNGDLLIAGYFIGTSAFAGQTITAAGTTTSDAFLARMTP